MASMLVFLGVSCAVSAEDASFFDSDVEPILAKRCYECHSHSSGTMEGGLTLDYRGGWETGGDRGAAIVPGDPDQSLLIRAVRHVDPDLRMPEQKLPDSEIAVLVRWVTEGAHDARVQLPSSSADAEALDWWSLRPLIRPEVPVDDAANPVDAFILARLEREGLRPSPEADRRSLIRRLTYDLHGLIPTPAATEQFIADSSSDAWDALVNRLLDSPHYGERWARHWLDTVHFADSHGFEHDVFRPNAWRYRDYVIDSFNHDTAWPRFIREQLAADVFFPDNPELTVALGFLGAGPYDHSAASTALMSFEYLDRDDLVTQTMGAFVSTTANCARCHAHKFDPITQADYYALQAVFAGIGKGDIPFDNDPRVAADRTRWQALITAAEQRDAAVLLSEDNLARVAAWEQTRPANSVWQPLDADVFVSAGGADLTRLDDGSILSGGRRPDRDTVVVTTTTTLPAVTAIRLDVLCDDSLPMNGPGRMDNGNLHLNEFELRAFRSGEHQGRLINIQKATADFNQTDWSIDKAVDGNSATAWGIHPAVSVPHHAVFELTEPLVMDSDVRLAITLQQVHGSGHLIGRFRLSATSEEPASLVALSAEAEAVLALPRKDRSSEQRLLLASEVLRQLAEHELQKLPAPVKVYAAAATAENERGVITFAAPREIHLLTRGDIEKPREAVPPGALSAVTALPARFELPSPGDESARRAALANWLADPNNPLTWRSIANRVWHYHFGQGLCDTPNDFGRMGSLPTHPELLDWLACELRDGCGSADDDSGSQAGSLKHLHRLICTSRTYRQSSAERSDLQQVDPDNRLLARMTRRRRDADSYRDCVLAVSGRLDLRMGGPGVAHFTTSPGPQLTPVLDYDAFDLDSEEASRRSIYRVVWRGIPDPLMDALDFPDLGLLAPVRGSSASALQSLVLLNHRFVLHHAAHMARRAEQSAPSRDDQVRQAVRRVWLRDPTTEELQSLTKLADEHGLEAVCRLLLNSSEFLFVE
ncbi:MAG: PSD1 and planctomycete cytochrome C domain-containing protein [Planctomycetaceae bacterium]